MKTIPNLFLNSVEKYSGNILIKEKTGQKYEGFTYKEIYDEVESFSAGLIKLGLDKGERVALISEPRKTWITSELGILFAGAVCVPLSTKLGEAADVMFRISHSESTFVIISKSQLAKFKEALIQIPGLKHIIILDNIDEIPENYNLYSDIVSAGLGVLKSTPSIVKDRMEKLSDDDLANICYTSGTSADPKGIMLTHRNYTANIEQANSIFEVPSWYTTLLILPWDHSFAHTAGIYTVIKNGSSIASVQTGATLLETLKNIPINIKEIKPVFLLSVPALTKNFKKNIENAILDKGKILFYIFSLGIKISVAYNGNGMNKGKGFRLLLKPIHILFDKIIYKKIKENFGGRLQFMIGGGALLDLNLQNFFYALGIPIYQGYGLTEASPIISSNSTKKHKLGSSGCIVSNLEIKIVDDQGTSLKAGEKGEIIVKGENVMKGYWKNPAATNETIRNGWLYTGDMGYIDNDGFLNVLGRFKSLLIGNDGEKYSPEGIEEALIEHSPLIDQCMLFNDQNQYTVALIVPDSAKLRNSLLKHNLSGDTDEGQIEAIKMIQKDIDMFTSKGKYAGLFPTRWIPSTFALLNEPFTEQNKLINSTLKMVRPKITETYKRQLEFLFTPEGKNVFNSENKEAVFKLLSRKTL